MGEKKEKIEGKGDCHETNTLLLCFSAIAFGSI